ncbi:anaerobic glycerol-3-phosphate dehydrogenase subunit A [uncultured Muribaculum sp.]|uniref:anaerobic glycerol-3-phosphate dehydrogenase subunit A n=1 Tax=uncultured Muribaculum sp. TaxID=1918613 RepID=UPI0026753FEC|nr:anaerobic glycerol-3-phosphate dehydrogenase subunit A [uncultured Muribaculum sp.]
MNQNTPSKLYDVIVIGGGATGAGTARDCALRGLSTLLVERFDFTAGATGRNHGLLHSGARYAVTDPESATECIKENRILRHIASHCVEDTGGLFITLPEDSLDYQHIFINACLKAGIQADAIDPKEALRLEPSVNSELTGAVRVPDGSIDPFRLTVANVMDARMHGADILTYHEVVGFIRNGDTIEGVDLRNTRNGEISRRYGRVVVNAAGIWGHHLAKLAGITINMFPAKGSLLIFGHRINNMVINRCRKPGDADILVPGDTISVIGTTSTHIPYNEIDHLEVTPEEVDILMHEGSKLSPEMASTRILRAYAGVRPLVASDDDPSGRSISRGIVCLDHALRDGLNGFITITGGKLITYRLMAELATDMVCRKLCSEARCQTAELPLPGSSPIEGRDSLKEKRSHIISIGIEQLAAEDRHGTMSRHIDFSTPDDETLVCECEQVSVGEVEYAIKELHVDSLINLRRRTRLGMGTCQGELCACRAAGLLAKANGCAERSLTDLASFVAERWKGMYPVGWGETLVEGQLMSWLYEGVCGIDKLYAPKGTDCNKTEN